MTKITIIVDRITNKMACSLILNSQILTRTTFAELAARAGGPWLAHREPAASS